MIFRTRAAFLLLFAVCVTATATEPFSVTANQLTQVSGSALSRAAAAVEPANEAVLAAQINALITSVSADIADSVAKGDLLARLDPTDFQLAVDQAQASLAAQDSRITQARERLRRAMDLKARDYASADELLARETDVAVLDADRKVLAVALAIAQRELEKTRIVAPFNGVVTARAAQVGALATPGSALVTLVQSGKQTVVAHVPPAQAATLQPDSAVFFEADGTRWRLQLVSLSPVIDARRRVQAVRFAFSAAPAPPGLSGYIVWRSAQPMIGTQYVVRRGDSLGVFIVEDGRARFHPLANAEEGRAAAVTLPAATMIVTSGQHQLQDGDLVSVSQ